jgi:hypothetical protein
LTRSLKGAWFQSLNLKCGVLVSKFAAFSHSNLCYLYRCYGEVVMNHFCSKPALVFCNSRDGCVVGGAVQVDSSRPLLESAWFGFNP